tara:strand:- start:108 stop:401 length:294 start_codon:yes stop_codon:yes gene_type:complete
MGNFVVFFGCNKKQLPYLNEIKKKKYRIILIDKNKKNLGIKISDNYFCSSYLDYKKLDKIYNKIKKKKFPIFLQHHLNLHIWELHILPGNLEYPIPL